MTSTIRITLAHDPDLRRALAAVRREFARDQQAHRRACTTDYRAAYAAERQAELADEHQAQLAEHEADRAAFFGEQP